MKEVSQSQLRPLLIIKAMKGRSFTGISNVEIASKIGSTPSSVSRAINVLIHAGFVEQLDNGLYALSTEALNIATSHAREVQAINAKLAEINN
ncbi:MarR family transcriptional regulator [Ignatzschineria rhizosphaerae]|uniref:MarR family transcriptional regulator n=1 Tax=Ignatzschineria rhizosphaerae TaxID=2923279 RepID=A0ABY3X1W5_9GAMM|nr:helix-turn-helix domain-containing protein [Ignatzschineria rhizosphaerae]UNM95689.1 MarR family transcriptional regulator [Ignatzschineria rhizosphaerae]